MKYKDLVVRSYARSASNFIIYNSLAITHEVSVSKDHWSKISKPFDNEVVVTVLRDPRQAIVSDISMSIYDTYSGMDELLSFNYQESIDSFKNYMSVLKANLYNVVPFTFEQITENPEKSFKIFLNECGYKEEFVFPDVEIKQKVSINQLMNKKQIFLPSSRLLNIYNDINDYVSSHGILDVLVDEYKECMYLIYMRQLDF